MKQFISPLLLTFFVSLLTNPALGETLEVGVDQALEAEQSPTSVGQPPQLGASITASVGTNLDPDEPEGALTFEPTVGWTFEKGQSLSLYSAIVRPLDPYDNFEAPKTVVTFTQPLPIWTDWTTSVGATANALSLHRWGTDGTMVRWGLFASISREFAPGLTAALRLSPLLQTNEFGQTTAGANLTRWGLTESLAVAYTTGPLTFEVSLVVGQRYNGTAWRNSYSSVQAVSYQAMEKVAFGLSHGLLSSMVDSSTGRYAPIRVFDGRDSEVSAFVTVAL